MNPKLRPAWMAAVLAAGLAGCASTASVKDVLADPEAYLAKFGTAAPEVAKMLPHEKEAVAFRRMEIEIKPSEVRSDEKSSERDLSVTQVLVNGGGNLVRSYETVRNNNVPFRMNYRVTYRNIVPIKWQTVFTSRPNANFPFEVKSMSKSTSIPAILKGGSAEFKMLTGSQMQVANYLDSREVCTAGATREARTLNAALAGDMTEMRCENYGANGQVVSNRTYAYLHRYGVGIETSFADSTSRVTNAVTSVKIQ